MIPLSTRQAQIAELVAKGKSDKVIAMQTGLSLKTVQVHVQRAAAKLTVGTTPRNKLTLWVLGVTDMEEGWP